MASAIEKKETVKDRLQKALISLCSEKNYLEITISELCQRAGTYRSAFYLYYDDKDQLLREIEDTYLQELKALVPDFRTYHPDFNRDEFRIYKQEMLQMMEYHYAHRELCLFLLSPDGDPYFAKQLLSSVRRICETTLLRSHVKLPPYLKYIIEFYCNGYVHTIYEWLRRNDRTPEEMATFMMKMILLFAAMCK